jgi:hypothetical protein
VIFHIKFLLGFWPLSQLSGGRDVVGGHNGKIDHSFYRWALGPSGYPRTALQGGRVKPINIPEIKLTNRFGFQISVRLNQSILRLSPLLVAVAFANALNIRIYYKFSAKSIYFWCIYGAGREMFRSHKGRCDMFTNGNMSSWFDIYVYIDLPSQIITIQRDRKCVITLHENNLRLVRFFQEVIATYPANFEIGKSGHVGLFGFVGSLCRFLVFLETRFTILSQSSEGKYPGHSIG